MNPKRRPLENILNTTLLDGSIVSTIYLGVSHPGPTSSLEALVHDEEFNFEEHETSGYWYETAIGVDGDFRVLRRHKTEAEAIVWHEEYLDNVMQYAKSSIPTTGGNKT